MAKHRTTDKTADAPLSDDALTFRAAVRDVKPLAHTAPAPDLDKTRRRRRAQSSAATSGELAETMPLIGDGPPTDVSSDVRGGLAPKGDAQGGHPAGIAALTFRRPGVRTQVLRRLRRGLYPIEDELDLHGLTQIAARDTLAEFIAQNRYVGHRCVRIIHGKGHRSGARGPILKIAVDTWLRRHGDVMAFASARSIDGGTGAVYVLLRA
jgi:DNA-nicking Smr family endonuclease